MESVDALRAAARAADAVTAARSDSEAAEAAAAAVAPLGYHFIGAIANPGETAMPDPASAVLFSNAPEEQVAKYRERGYARHDPVVQRTLRSQAPRTLSAIGDERLGVMERKIYEKMHCATGSQDGLVIPVRRSVHPDGVIIFGGATPDLRPPIRAALTVIGYCLYGRLTEPCPAAPKGLGFKALSPREREVLRWVAQGKSDGEIAVILGMAERTARFHVANAKRKLAATTRVQAVTRALDLGLIAG